MQIYIYIYAMLVKCTAETYRLLLTIKGKTIFLKKNAKGSLNIHKAGNCSKAFM